MRSPPSPLLRRDRLQLVNACFPARGLEVAGFQGFLDALQLEGIFKRQVWAQASSSGMLSTKTSATYLPA